MNKISADIDNNQKTPPPEMYSLINIENSKDSKLSLNDAGIFETLKNTMWLHAWRIFATSPFANAIVFTTASITQ